MPPSSVKEINVGANLVPAMLSGRVDATLGAYWNYEAIQLAQMGKHPNVIRVDKVGVPSYDELVVVVRQSTLAQHPDQIRRFLQALARGYESVRSDPSAAVGNLVRANPGLDRKLQLASVRATLARVLPGRLGQPVGLAGPGAVERLRPVDAEEPPDHEPERPSPTPRPTRSLPGRGCRRAPRDGHEMTHLV